VEIRLAWVIDLKKHGDAGLLQFRNACTARSGILALSDGFL
jgi:hypothetical protein